MKYDAVSNTAGIRTYGKIRRSPMKNRMPQMRSTHAAMGPVSVNTTMHIANMPATTSQARTSSHERAGGASLAPGSVKARMFVNMSITDKIPMPIAQICGSNRGDTCPSYASSTCVGMSQKNSTMLNISSKIPDTKFAFFMSVLCSSCGRTYQRKRQHTQEHAPVKVVSQP